MSHSDPVKNGRSPSYCSTCELRASEMPRNTVLSPCPLAAKIIKLL